MGTPSSTSSLLSSLGETTGGDFASGVSGLLSVHLLAGRGLRTTTTSSAATTPSTPSGQPNLGTSDETFLCLHTVFIRDIDSTLLALLYSFIFVSR